MDPKTTLNRAEWARIQRRITIENDGCWLWTGPQAPAGYGKHRRGPGHPERVVHRIMWEHHHGPIPDGYQLDHLCHTQAVEAGLCDGGTDCRHRLCCNPEHLELVTPSENTRRQNHANRAKAECPQGHPYTPENTRIASDGKRRCRTCERERRRISRGPSDAPAPSHV